MRQHRSPATLVIVARVDDATSPEAFARVLATMRGRGATVTWSMTPTTLVRLSPTPSPEPVTLSLDAATASSRRELRQSIGVFRRVQGAVEAVTFPAQTAVSHRDVLVEEGIHVAGSDIFDDAGRGSRRPAPPGWRCRSALWGLWEVATSRRGKGGFARWLPWGGRMAPGSLTIETVDLDADPVVAAASLARVVERHGGATGEVRAVTLGGLAGILGPETVSGGGSVLRAA